MTQDYCVPEQVRVSLRYAENAMRYAERKGNDGNYTYWRLRRARLTQELELPKK